MQAAIALRQYLTAKSRSVCQISSDRCSRPIHPGLGIPLAESSSFLAWVLTRRDKPNPRGDDSDSHTNDGVEEPKDWLCPTALRADFGDNHQDRGCDSRSDRVTYPRPLVTARWVQAALLPGTVAGRYSGL